MLSKLRTNRTYNDSLWRVPPATTNPPIITLSPVCTKLRVLMLRRVELEYRVTEIIHFGKGNPCGVVYTTYHRGVVTRWQRPR